MPYVVYVLTNPAMPGMVKIGQTQQDEADTRLRQLYSTGVPFPFTLEYACQVPNGDEVERALHEAFGPYRVNPRREFFQIEPLQAIAILKLLHQDATDELAAELSTQDQADVAAGEAYRARRRPNFDFLEMGVPVGSQLSCTGADVTVEVIGRKKVRMNGAELSLSAATQQALNVAYQIAPLPNWRFNGRLLRDIYEETYPFAG